MNIEQMLIDGGFTMVAKCIEPGDYKTSSVWSVALNRNGKSYSTQYTQGAAYRVFTRKSKISRSNQFNTGDKVPFIHRPITVSDKEILENNTKPSEPKLADVVYSLVSDAGLVRHGQSFEDFCSDMGLSDDSHSAEKCYNACRDTWSAMVKLGVDFDKMDELFRDY